MKPSVYDRIFQLWEHVTDRQEGPVRDCDDYSVIISHSQEAELLADRELHPGLGLGSVMGLQVYSHENATDIILVPTKNLSAVVAGLSLTEFQADVLSGHIKLSAAEKQKFRTELTVA